MRFTFTVEVEVERNEGKFASRDEVGDLLIEEIESADPSFLSCEDGGEYEVVAWEITENPQPKRGKR